MRVGRVPAFCAGLPTQSKPPDEALVAAYILTAEVIKETAPLGNHGYQAPPGMHVFAVSAEVVGHLTDTLREHGDLQFG